MLSLSSTIKAMHVSASAPGFATSDSRPEASQPVGER